MENINNKENIEFWSKDFQEFSDEVLRDYEREGDFFRKHLLNPVFLHFLGNIENKKILDAGCGEGYFARILARKKANLWGLEPSTGIERAKEIDTKEKLGIKYLQEDLSDLKGFDDFFDFIVSINVFMDIPDYIPALDNCIRSLKKGGVLIYSILHPCFESIVKDNESYIVKRDFEEKGYLEIAEYFENYQAKQNHDFITHRTISQYINDLIIRKMKITGFIEPQLDKTFEEHEGKIFRDCHVPNFLIIAAKKE